MTTAKNQQIEWLQRDLGRANRDLDRANTEKQRAIDDYWDAKEAKLRAQADFRWLVEQAFPDIDLDRPWTQADSEEYLKDRVTFVAEFKPPATKAKTIAELRKEVEDKLERDYFKSLSQNEKIQYLFEQRQKCSE